MLTLFQKDIFLNIFLNAPYVGTGTDVNLFLKDLYDENNWFDNIACLNNNTIYKIYKTVLQLINSKYVKAKHLSLQKNNCRNK